MISLSLRWNYNLLSNNFFYIIRVFLKVPVSTSINIPFIPLFPNHNLPTINCLKVKTWKVICVVLCCFVLVC